MTSEARIPTPTAARYVTRLCKHFAHKVPATYDESGGRIEFPFGVATLTPDADALTIRTDADDAEALARLEDVIERHLVRFAEPETLAVEWVRNGEGESVE